VLVRFLSRPCRKESERCSGDCWAPPPSTRFVAEVALMVFSAGNLEQVAKHEDSTTILRRNPLDSEIFRIHVRAAIGVFRENWLFLFLEVGDYPINNLYQGRAGTETRKALELS